MKLHCNITNRVLIIIIWNSVMHEWSNGNWILPDSLCRELPLEPESLKCKASTFLGLDFLRQSMMATTIPTTTTGIDTLNILKIQSMQDDTGLRKFKFNRLLIKRLNRPKSPETCHMELNRLFNKEAEHNKTSPTTSQSHDKSDDKLSNHPCLLSRDDNSIQDQQQNGAIFNLISSLQNIKTAGPLSSSSVYASVSSCSESGSLFVHSFTLSCVFHVCPSQLCYTALLSLLLKVSC